MYVHPYVPIWIHLYIYICIYTYIHVVQLLLFFAVLVEKSLSISFGALLPLQAPLQYGEPPWQTPRNFWCSKGGASNDWVATFGLTNSYPLVYDVYVYAQKHISQAEASFWAFGFLESFKK